MKKINSFIVAMGVPLFVVWLALGLSCDFVSATVCMVIACAGAALVCFWVGFCANHFDNKKNERGFEPKNIDEFLEHERQELREMNEKWKKEHALNVAKAKADEFELSLIRSHLAKAEILERCYHSKGMSKEDCDQAIINGIRRMGFTREKIELAGYNPNVAEKGFYGTGGNKKNEVDDDDPMKSYYQGQ